MHIFTLPLECSPLDKPDGVNNGNNGQTVVDIAKDIKQGEQKDTTAVTEPLIEKPKSEEEFISQRYEPRKISFFQRIIFTFKMVYWHILLFIVITVALYAGFHYGFDRVEKGILLDAFSFLYDWRPLVFFLGIYLSYTVKKVSDISSVSCVQIYQSVAVRTYSDF